MKTTFTSLIFWLIGTVTLAQGSSDYYRTRETTKRTYDRLLVRYGSPLTERWYVGAEGFVRTDNSQLSSSFGGLVSTNTVTRPGWSTLIGWTARDWAIETGYARSPIHNELAVSQYTFRFTNEQNGFILRGKRQLFSTSPQARRSGIWVTAGLWLIPNAGETKNQLSLEGYGRRTYQRETDTLSVVARTRTNHHTTGMAELGLEYTVRLSSRVELGVFGRKYWGIGSSIITDIDYSVNGRAPEQATLQGRGSGASLGISLRYTYTNKHAIAQTSIYDLRGNAPAANRSRLNQ